jgi:hypothetical protein
MGRGRPKKRKEWPKPELHPGINYSRGYVPRVGGRAADDYDVESGEVRSLRKWRQLTFLGLGALALFTFVAWFVWPRASGFGDVLGAFAILGKYFVLVVGPLILVGVVVYYYTGVGIEWSVRTLSRLTMIGACIGIAIFAAVLTAGYLEGRLDEYASLGWIVALLVIVAVAGYLGQRDGGA